MKCHENAEEKKAPRGCRLHRDSRRQVCSLHRLLLQLQRERRQVILQLVKSIKAKRVSARHHGNHGAPWAVSALADPGTSQQLCKTNKPQGGKGGGRKGELGLRQQLNLTCKYYRFSFRVRRQGFHQHEPRDALERTGCREKQMQNNKLILDYTFP